MQSMKFPQLFSFGARRTKDGFGQRTTWLMVTLAALFAVLAVAVPTPRSASADAPEITLSVTDVEYETATLSINVTDVDSSLNWKVNVVFKTDAYEHPHKNAGPTHTVSQGQESYSFDYDAQGSTVTADVYLNWLIPASDYTVEVKLCDTDCGSRNVKAEASTTFSTNSGCTPHPTNRGRWFPGYHFTKVTENELTVRVHVNSSYAPLNSGRCVYYTYNTYFEHDDSEILTAYIRHIGSGGRTAQIELTDLEPGTRYGYHITLDVEAEDNAAGFSGSTLGPNTGISDIEFTDITNDSAKATATIKNASADDKFVYWRYRESPLDGDPGIWLTLDKVSTKTSTADKDLGYLDAGTRYEVEASVKENFNPGMSMTRAFVTLPGKPTIDSVTPGDGRLTVNWTAPAETPAPLTGYRVQWQDYDEYTDYITFPPPTLTLDYEDVDADVTNYTIENLTNGKEYVVHVIAKNESFDDYGGTASNEAYATPMGLPNAPNNLQVVGGNEKLTLTWEAPTVQVGVTVNGYKVQWKADTVTDWDAQTGVTEVSVGANVLTREITGLDNSTTYDVRVRADNGVSSDNYSWANGTGTTLPDTPENLEVASGNGQLTVTWEEPSETGSVAITGYAVQYMKTSDPGWTSHTTIDAVSGTTSYDTIISSLVGSTDYEVRVRAVTTVVLTDEDDYNWANGDGVTIPDSPVNLQVAPGNERLNLTWEAPTESNSISINGFIVQYKKTADSSWTSLTSLSAGTFGTTIGNLDNGDLYSVRVRAVNTAALADEEDYNWAEGSGTPVPDPSITRVTVDPNSITQTEATVTVTLDRTNNVEQTVYLQYQTVPNGEWSAPAEEGKTDTTSVDIGLDALEGNTQYKVRAWLATDPDTKVESDTFTTDPVVPGVPTNTVVAPGIEILKLEWDPPSEDGGEAVDHYVIEWAEYSTQNWNTPLGTATATAEEYEITGLDNGTRYGVRVRADNGAPLLQGKSYNWVFGDGTPRTKPAAPTVAVTPGSAKLNVGWNKPDDGGEEITGFVVQYMKSTDQDWTLHASPGSNTFETTIPDLENGETYLVRVRAVNSVGLDEVDAFEWGTGSGVPRTIPAEPTITLEAGDGQLEVSWNKPDDGGDTITGFVVQYKKNTDTSWTDHSTPGAADTTETITSLENGVTYTVRVRAVNSVVLDDEKDYNWGTASDKPRTIPGEPTVGVTVGNAQFEVTWNKPGAGGDTITGFVVQYMKDTDTGWTDHSTPGPNDTTTTISSLDNGGMYTVRIRAVNSVVLDNEDDYNWGEDFGKPKTIPLAPINLVVTHGSLQLNATWDAPTGDGHNGGDEITNYEVQWKEKEASGWSSPSTADVSASATLELDIDEHLMLPLTNGVTYEVRVRTVNTALPDAGQDFNWVYGEETPSTTPGAPQSVRISNQGNAELTVAWSAPSATGGADIGGYVVQWKVKGVSGWATNSTSEEEIDNATTFTHTFNRHLSQSLVNGISYMVRVIAKNRNGRGTASPEVEGKPRTTPNAPTNLQVTEGNKQLELTWRAPTVTGGTDIDYYFVEYKKDGDANFTSEQTADDTEGWTLDELENGKLYTIQVKSHTEGGTSDPSGSATGKPRTIPGAPTITGITEGNGTLTVAWAAPTDNGGADPTKYIIEWEEWIVASSRWQASGNDEDDKGSPYEIGSLPNGIRYRVVVKAHNAAGTGPASGPMEGTPKTIPDTPTVSLEPGDEQFKVTWNKPGDGGDEITGFVVQYMKDTDTDWTAHSMPGPADTTGTITGLDNGHPYTVRVRAVNTAEPDAGQEYNWGEASDIPRTIPDTPSVSLTHGDRLLKVIWSKPDNGGDTISGFVVQYKKAADTTWSGTTPPQPGANDTETTISSLENGVPYDVRVRAVNNVVLDDEDDYNWGTSSETPRTIPGPVTNLGVIAGNEELTVSWVAPTPDKNGGAAIDQYILQWKFGNEEYDSESNRQTTTTDLSKVLTPLSNGILYSIRVRADNGEVSDNYNWVEKTGTPMTVPGAPTQLRVEAGDKQLIVSWVAPVETGGVDVEIDHFVIQWKLETVNNWNSPGEHTATDETVLTDTITSLTNGEMYDIRVRADNNVEGQTFQWALTTGKPRTIPSAPRSLGVTAGDGQLSLSWLEPSDGGGLTINQYIVQWKSGGQQYDTSRQATPNITSQVIGQLTNDTPYDVRVRADNTVAASTYNWTQGTGTPTVTLSPPPPPPQNPPPQRSPVVPNTPTPSVLSVSADNITKTTARAVVKIDNHDGTKLTVELRYQVKAKVQDWETDVGTAQAISNTSPATKPLESLTKGTKYVLQASFDDTFPDDATEEYTFTTLPSILSVSVDNVGRTSARATINIANSDGSQQIAKLQFREKDANPVEEWNTRPVETAEPTTGATALIDLSGLTADTRYDVQAWLASDETDKKTAVFGTSQAQQQQRSPSPIISNLKFENIGQTSATAMVGIDNAGTDMKDVYLKHSIHGTDEWAMLPTPTPTYGDSTSIDLGGLQEKTTYEVAVALSDDFDGMVMGTFTTLVGRSLSGVTISDITQTSAVATVSIANSGTTVEKTVYLRHREFGESGWGTAQTMATTGASAAFDLTGLTPRTMYKVQASFSNNFTGTVTATFTTLAPDPSLSRVTVKDIKQTTATAEISIADPGEGSHTVRLRYRTTTPQGAWSGTQTVNNSTVIYGVTLSDGEIKRIVMGISRISMSGLTTDTEYEVQASLDSSFASIVSATFITLRHSSLSAIDVTDITKTSATAEIDIADPDGTEQTTHLRYRTTTPQGDWSGTLTTTSATAEASIDLSGLTTDTEYEVEASLTSDFAVTVSDTFTTLPADPVVSKVDVSRIRQTTATADINIANSNGTEQIVHLHYRTTTPRGDWSETLMTSTADSASIDLSGLTPDTEYEVQASLDSAFTYAVSATFTTLRYPSLIDINVTDITKTTATSEVYIADPDGTSQTVHLRYRTTMPQGAWSGTQTADIVEVTIVRELSNGETTEIVTGRASINMSGLTTDTEYEVEASLTSDFAITVLDTFRTLPPDPVVSSVNVSSIRQTTATADIDIANSNGTEQTVHLSYRTTTPRGDWSNIQTTTSTTDSASIDLSSLTPGTEYDVQASLDGSFPTTRTKYAIFTTLRYPSIASVEAENIGRNGATVSATIADSHGAVQTVYVRHRQSRYIDWRPTQQTDSADDIASLRLRGLSSDTEYIAEASLDDSFPSDETRSVTFTTKKRSDDDDGSGTVVAQPARAVNVPLPGFSPLMLRFTAIEGGDNPAPQSFSVWNRAQGPMDFSLSNHEEWLSLQPLSGMSGGPAEPVNITASVDSSELAAGQYVDVINIKVSSSGRTPGQIVVVLDVVPPDYVRQFVSRDEGGVVVLPDGTVKIVVAPLAPPKDVDIELMKLNLLAHGVPPGEQERVIVATESNTYPPGGDTPEDVAYSSSVELWVMLPKSEANACAEGKIRLYSVQSGDWSLVEHRCETDEASNVWAVSEIERLGAFALVIDDSPATTAVAAPAPTPVSAVRLVSSGLPVQRVSLPAVAPTPVPTAVPTPLPILNGRPAATPVAAEVSVSTTPELAVSERSVPAMQASVETQGSGGFNGLILGALGLPLLIGGGIVVLLFYRERRRNGEQLQ